MAGVNPNSRDFDRYGLEIARALELAWLRDGQNSPSEDLPMAGRKFTGVGEADRSDQFATKGQIDAAVPPFIAAGDVGGTASAITLNVVAPPARAAGRGFRFFAKAINPGALTVSEAGRAAAACKRSDGSVFEGGELAVGQLVEIVWDGAGWRTNIGLREWFGTEAQFNALATKYSGVIYYRR